MPALPEQPKASRPPMVIPTAKKTQLCLSHSQPNHDSYLPIYLRIDTKAHDLTAITSLPNPVNSGSLDIKIIGTILFACILQDSTPAFQLQITPALLEEHLHIETIMLESKREEQILSEKAFTSTLVLHHFNPSLPIVLECNASNYVIAGILSQLDSRGKDSHSIAFYTHLMIPVELNYDIYNKELLAIIEAFCQCTSQPQNNSAIAKLNGLKPSRSTTSPSTTALDNLVVSSFYANKGYNPQLTLSLKDIPSHISYKVTKDLQSLYQFLQDEIDTANQAYSKHANAQHKLTPNWPPGTLV
ncbi:hypothetical protein E4T56_gene20382 [Termitomyces sp. T112]|nr:hypothetical protein E4T56_gene20382 [Termitomyces sp. T112]